MKTLIWTTLILVTAGCATLPDSPPAPSSAPASSPATAPIEPSAAAAVNAACNNDPAVCRMIVTSNQVYALVPNNMNAASSSAIIMRYDLVYDPASGNAIDPWVAGTDNLGKTAYDYTRSSGPLGAAGPLGYAGPLGSTGALYTRFIGTKPSVPGISYANNWCTVPANQPDNSCVYGSYGALGESGPLNPYYYYNTMYHLQQGTYWYGNYNQNLDAAGVWGIQGPLGPTGALAALGALGPLGISQQAGMTTTADGVYKNGSAIVRQTQPVRYSHDATTYRAYDLFEMYSKSYAKTMGTGCSGCEVNDTSFAVDSSFQEPVSGGDNYLFNSNYNQFVSINVVPINLYTSYALQLQVSTNGGVSYNPVATASSNPYAANGGLMNFIVTRAKRGETYKLNVTKQYSGVPFSTGYYLFVNGSGLVQIVNGVTNANPDIWGSRLQSNGTLRFNINGAQQSWISW